MTPDSPAKASKTIVYIEDDVDSVAFAKLALKDQPYNVIAVTDAADSLDSLRQHKPDLVLLDITMPAMNGWDVLRRMRADDELRQIPVIIVTARDSRMDEIYGTQIAKVQGYLRKPFDYHEFKQIIINVLAA